MKQLSSGGTKAQRGGILFLEDLSTAVIVVGVGRRFHDLGVSVSSLFFNTSTAT